MKVTVLAENLNKALSVVSRSVAVRPQLPILGNILFKASKDGLELLSTDLELSFRVKLGAKVETEGEVSLPAKILTELMATISAGTVELVVEKETAKLSAGKMRSTISAVSAGEFPAIPSFKGTADLIFEMEKLKSAIDRVAMSASKDDSRPVFTGMLWIFEGGKVTLVATDGYRLGIDEIKPEGEMSKELKKLIIPARSLQELVRVIDKDGKSKIEIKIEEDKQQVMFRVGEIELVSRLLAGEFPSYQAILPSTEKTKAEFDREELTEAVKRSAIFARESANIIKLQITDGKCKVSSNSEQSGSSETEIDTKQTGEPLVVAFNSRYLLDYLAGVSSDLIEFRSEGSLKPGVLVEIGKNKASFLQVIMPVRVQE